MKIFVIVLFVALVIGCGQLDRDMAKLTGQPSETCVAGVTYLQFTSGATVKIDVSGKPVACKQK